MDRRIANLAARGHGVVSDEELFALGLSRKGVARTRSLPDSQLTIRHGIPVTTVERTLLDFAAVASAGELRDAVRAAERLELLDAPLVADLCDRARGRRGSARLRALLEIPRGPVAETRSPLEDLFLPICADFGIRFPAVNVPLLEYVVDCLWLPEVEDARAARLPARGAAA